MNTGFKASYLGTSSFNLSEAEAHSKSYNSQSVSLAKIYWSITTFSTVKKNFNLVVIKHIALQLVFTIKNIEKGRLLLEWQKIIIEHTQTPTETITNINFILKLSRFKVKPPNSPKLLCERVN